MFEDDQVHFSVRMKMGKGSASASKRVLMTTGWAQAMARYQFKKDDIVMFLFEYHGTAGLVLLLHKVPA
jgi:hypothetical protein